MKLRDAHFYKRVPSDVSETTATGGLVSIIAFGTILWLVSAQYNEAFDSKRHTQLRLDRSQTSSPSGADSIRINFNITLHHLPCQYTQVHLSDHVGSHKMGGTRNVHKVRLSRDGSAIAMFEPHKYGDGQLGSQMAGHVFPWHKKEHAQGDATHQLESSRKHLSADQKVVVSKVETAIQTAGKGAHTGRRLLSIDEPNAEAAAAAPQAQPDSSPSCDSWATLGECVSNSAYMLSACETSCSKKASPDVCQKWAEGKPTLGRCHDAANFMSKFCPSFCAAGGPPSTPSAPGDVEAKAEATSVEAKAAEVPSPAAEAAEDEAGGVYIPSKPYDPEPAQLTAEAFTQLLKDYPLVMANFYAPWCFWSNKLTPAWQDTAKRLHARAWSQSVKMVRIDCTSQTGGEICRSQAVHAFPSVRLYRGSTHAFEPYEYGREDTVIWLHLVKSAAEQLIAQMEEADPEEKPALTQQVAHVSSDLRKVMDRRAQGLDEDWSEEALSAEEEVEEDRDILRQISEAVGSITRGKGVAHDEIMKATGVGGDLEGVHELEAEAHYVQARASETVLGLLTGRAPEERKNDPDAEMWTETETHEGCLVFGYIDVSRAPGTLHFSPHSARHSFDFSSVNTSHHIDHLSFGLELTARERAKLPASVAAQLTTLDGSEFLAKLTRETKEHHVMIMPTSVGPADDSAIETYQFTATSHGRTRDTLPSLLVSYDVSPIHAHISTKETPFSDFLVSVCAIIGGAVSLFGIVDAMLFTGASTFKKQMGRGKGF